MNLKKNVKKYWFVFFLIGIFILAFYVRVIPARFNELQALDPFYIYRISDYILNHNLQLPEVDTLRNYPLGDRSFDLYGAFYIPVFLYFFLNPILNINFFKFALLYPAIMGAFAVIVMFFIGKVLFNDDKVGLFSAFFLATVPAFITRTSAGFFEKESPGGIFMLLSILFFIKAFKDKNWKYGILSGIMVGLMGSSWGGVQYLYILYAVFAFVLLLINKNIIENLFSYTPTIIIGILIPLLIDPIRYSIFSPQILLPLSILILLFLRIGIEKLKLIKGRKLNFFVPILVVILILGLLVGSMFSDQIYNFTDRIIFMLSLKQAPTQTVAESTAGSWDTVISQTSVNPSSVFFPYLSFLFPIFSIWLFFILGIFLLVWKLYKTENYLLFLPLIWIVLSIAGTISAIRLIFFVGPSSAIIAGFFIHWLIKKLNENKIKNRILIKKISPIPILLAIFIILIILLNATTAYIHGSSIGPSICFARLYQNGSAVPCTWLDENGNRVYNTDNQPWYQALDFLRKETPKNSSVISWWDFGYWFQTRGERPTIADGGGRGNVSRYDLALWFTANADNWTDWKWFIKDQLNVSYILMDYTLPGKYGAITTIASEGKNPIGFLQFSSKPTNIYQKENKTIYEYSANPYAIWISLENGTVSEPPLFLISKNGQYQGRLYINDICTDDGILKMRKKEPSIKGCLSISSLGIYYIPSEAEHTIFTRLMFMEGAGLGVEKVFDNQLIKIYKVIWEEN